MNVTLGYAGVLGVWFAILSARVIQGRRTPSGPSLGDGGDPLMNRRIRGHGNFAEYVPLILVLLGGLEISGTPRWVLHSLGSGLLAGRVLHGYAFAFTENYPLGRVAGMALTLGTLLVASVLSIGRALTY